MSKIKVVHYILCFVLLFAMAAGLAIDKSVLAAQDISNNSLALNPGQEEPPAEETLEMESKYPVLSAKSGGIYDFEVDLKYQGNDRKRFEFSFSTPTGWRAFATAGYPEKQITAIEMGPAEGYPVTEKLKVTFGSITGKYPEPGDYILTVEASSGDLKATFDFKAVVTARYEFSLTTPTGQLNTEANTGKENHFSILLTNTGSTAIENIALSSTKPSGWNVTFEPKKVDLLESGLSQEIDVVIEPPSKTIAGDYEMTLKADSIEYTPSSMKVRVTVLSPTIWGWIGVIIVLLVIAGLGVLFWRLGRR